MKELDVTELKHKGKRNSIDQIVTCFNIGKIKYAPGTFGSLAAYPLFLFIVIILILITIIIPVLKNIFFIYFSMILITGFLFYIGCKYSTIYMNIYSKDDPGEIVIDELVGQLLVIIMTFQVSINIYHSQGFIQFLLYFFIAPFILFRVFDILKPWPISWLDKNIKSGFGVMLDDIAASILSILLYYYIYFLIN